MEVNKKEKKQLKHAIYICLILMKIQLTLKK